MLWCTTAVCCIKKKKTYLIKIHWSLLGVKHSSRPTEPKQKIGCLHGHTFKWEKKALITFQASESKTKQTLGQSVCYHLWAPLGKETGSKSKTLLNTLVHTSYIFQLKSWIYRDNNMYNTVAKNSVIWMSPVSNDQVVTERKDLLRGSGQTTPGHPCPAQVVSQPGEKQFLNLGTLELSVK